MARPCCSSVLTATKRIVDRLAASAIASASAASFFWRLTKGLTYIGGINRTSWPRSRMARPQWCALPQASVATMQRGGSAKKARTFSRESFLRNTTPPSARAPCAWKDRFARSRPMMLTFFMDAFSVRGMRKHHHLGTLRCRQEGASTPSLDVRRARPRRRSNLAGLGLPRRPRLSPHEADISRAGRKITRSKNYARGSNYNNYINNWNNAVAAGQCVGNTPVLQFNEATYPYPMIAYVYGWT